MSEKIQRAADGEKVKASLLDEKKLKTVMKRFLGSKESDPEITKYYHIENGINYSATTLGSAIYIYFKNKHDGTFTKGTGETFFRKPLANDKNEDVKFIPEYEIVTEGKKKVKRATGRTLEYPDVAGMFRKFDLKEFVEIDIDVEDLDDFIAVHEAYEKAAKVGGRYFAIRLDINETELKVSAHDSKLEFNWTYQFPKFIDSNFALSGWHYDPSLMISIFKSLKDLKPDRVKMYVKNEETPILFVGQTIEYNFNFAIQRKLVR